MSKDKKKGDVPAGSFSGQKREETVSTHATLPPTASGHFILWYPDARAIMGHGERNNHTQRAPHRSSITDF